MYSRIPLKVDWENNVMKDSMEWEWQMAVARLFDQRPIWPRWSLHECLLEDGLQVPENYLTRSSFYAILMSSNMLQESHIGASSCNLNQTSS